MSDADSSESECDWEEVIDDPTTSHLGFTESATLDYKFPNEGIQITLDKKDFEIGRRDKKALDPAGIIRRELNRQKRELQVDLHHVSLLCLLSQGLRFNGILRDQELFDIASIALQSKKSANLPKHVDLGYMEKFVRWFRGTYVVDPELVLVDNNKGEESVLKVCTIKQHLSIQLTEYKVTNNNYLVFIFVLILRSLGIQARLIWSLHPLPLKPRPEDLIRVPSKIVKKKPKKDNTMKPESELVNPSQTKKRVLDSNANNKIATYSKAKSSTNKNKKRKLTQKHEESSDDSEDESKNVDEMKGKVSVRAKTAKQSISLLEEPNIENSKKKPVVSKNITEGKKYDSSREDNRSCLGITPRTPGQNEMADSPMKRVLRSQSQSKPATTKNNGKYSKRIKAADSEPQQGDSESSESDSDFDPTPKKNMNIVKKTTSGSRDSDDSFCSTSRRLPPHGSQKDITDKKYTSSERTKSAVKIFQGGVDSSDDSSSDFAPTPKNSRKNNLQKSSPITASSNSIPTHNTKKIVSTKSTVTVCDFWAEVYLEEEERWISIDLIDCQFLCDSNFERKSVQPLYYVLAFGNLGQVKDVTRRYASQWLTVTQKNRTDNQWWNSCIRPFRGIRTSRDREEDDFLDQQVLSQAHPKSIQEFKNHPLFVLRRHLLKFEAIYPPEPIAAGFIRNEPFFSRECVKILHAREPWLKKAKVVRMGETPYKVVKSRPKYIRLTGQVIKDQPLELFGEWQVEDYIPPTAKDGKIPRNEYGNVNLFLQKMLPRGTVHLDLPGLQRVARKLDIDCAPAVVGFDFHGGSHPIFQGFVVCEEHKDILLDAWNQDQDELVRKEEEKRKARIYGNWEKLIKGVLIREKLEHRYSFNLGGKRKPPNATKSTDASTTSDIGDAPSSRRRRRGC